MKIKINKFFHDGKPAISVCDDYKIRPDIVLTRFCEHTPENITKMKNDFCKMYEDYIARQAF